MYILLSAPLQNANDYILFFQILFSLILCFAAHPHTPRKKERSKAFSAKLSTHCRLFNTASGQALFSTHQPTLILISTIILLITEPFRKDVLNPSHPNINLPRSQRRRRRPPSTHSGTQHGSRLPFPHAHSTHSSFLDPPSPSSTMGMGFHPRVVQPLPTIPDFSDIPQSQLIRT
jgi:hypothetical protein